MKPLMFVREKGLTPDGSLLEVSISGNSTPTQQFCFRRKNRLDLRATLQDGFRQQWLRNLQNHLPIPGKDLRHFLPRILRIPIGFRPGQRRGVGLMPR